MGKVRSGRRPPVGAEERLFAEVAVMVAPFGPPLVDAMVQVRRDPFQVLVATVLSLRTKDEVTGPAAARLLARAATPEAMGRLPVDEVAELIYPVGFYKTKARTVVDLCHTLVGRYDGRVPDDMDALLALKGVGRKTANLVLSAGFGQDAICVDTHVHRIANRWGYVTTPTPADTEATLRRKLPRVFWQPINGVLVTMGQHVCTPLSPFCSRCSLAEWWCARCGVGRSR